jgi:cholesterol transport system auxiliary component
MISACAAALCMALAGCSALKLGASPTPPTYYSLDASPASTVPRAAGAASYTLIVNETQAAAGFDSQRIIYVRQPHKLEYFAHNEWVDPPARMISSLIVGSLEKSGVFRAVVSSPGSASGELRLETEVLLLQQEFTSTPSRVRFALRAYLAEDGTRRVVATRDIEAVVPAPGDDPYGGVQAANAAVQNVLDQLTAFCAQTAAGWQPSRRVGSR